MKKIFLYSIALIPTFFSVCLAQPTLPELPRTSLDTSYNLPMDGKTWTVNAGGDLQAAIDSASLGDVIVLQAGATFTGNFVLKNKGAGSGWIYIISSALSSLPAEGDRVGPSDAVNMPRLQSTNKSNTVRTEAGAHNYRLVGIEITTTYSANDVYYNIVRLYGGVDNIFFDRCYIHGTSEGNYFDGIAVSDTKRFAVINSHISDIHVAQGQSESHGMQIIHCDGPCKIENNYIEGAGINLFFGDNFDIPNPAQDVVIRGNHVFKPLSWKNPIPSGPNAGLTWKVKNHFELKAAKRLLVEGNIFENCWYDRQRASLVITPRGGNVTDITFRKNIVRNTYTVMGMNPADPNRRVDRVMLENNLFVDTERRIFRLGRGSGEVGTDITIRHNTVSGTIDSYALMFFEGQAPAFDQFLVQDNIFDSGRYGIGGTGMGSVDAVNNWLRNYSFNNDAIIAGSSKSLTSPPFNNYYFPADRAAVGFSSLSLSSTEDFRLAPSSPYKLLGTDGLDLGADIDALLQATACTESGACSGVDSVGPGSPKKLRLSNR